MEVVLAKNAGFCFGVDRAVNMAIDTASTTDNCFSLGLLIHNSDVVDMLSEKGLSVADEPSQIPTGGVCIIRAHGVGESVYKELTKRGVRIVDATCPFVAKIHKTVRRESELGHHILIIGSANHPEVKGIAGWCSSCDIVESMDELLIWAEKWRKNGDLPVSVVAQTTTNIKKWNEIVNFIKKECTNAKIFDTICSATEERQTCAQKLARESDIMVVIGDRLSSNTNKLYEICREHCAHTILIENASAVELNDEAYVSRIKSAKRIGVTAGASTPSWIIKEVINKMSEEMKNVNTAADAEESFEALYEQFINNEKGVHNGDKIVGTVVGVSTDVQVEIIGVKHSAFIPYSELSDDPNYKATDHYKVGDEIEASVVRVNDAEGVITLSKKRLDAMKGWDTVEAASDNGEVVEGVVCEENKGGVVVTVCGVRVFVPASRTGLGKDVPMSTLLRENVKLKITEVNRARRRVVGDIRAVAAAERKALSEKVWADIAVGNTYHGVVKSLTSYGAFVDIGGVDGMVHISELSWNRVKHPSDVLSIGQEIDVFVIALDAEKKKISLGYRREEDNPWTKFTAAYNVGDVASVKILKFMPFGAFAEIIPGVDGLIHISQISATQRVNKPEDVLTEGEVVDAKITDIDMEKKKISLSIRALTQETAEEAVAEEATEEVAAEESAE